MKKRKIQIINFLHLSEEKYNKIREYRNQEYVRKVSNSTSLISLAEHENYHKLLEQKDKFFAWLLVVDGRDYGVITLKKLSDENYYAGDYLVNEIYKFEGGGVVNSLCTLFICNKIGAKFISYDIKTDNTRAYRRGSIGEVQSHEAKQDSFCELLKLTDFYDANLLKTRARIAFDKMYEIIDFIN
ncbi:MAG: hypothetical protein K5978_03075 [Campylobacter sp.]|nr:hypothetical protein [Campylobacter sp.]